MNCNFGLYNEINEIIESEYKDCINIVSFGGIYKDELKDFFDIYLKDLFLAEKIKDGSNYIFSLKDVKNKKDYVMRYSLETLDFCIYPIELNDYKNLSFDDYEEVLCDKKIVGFSDNKLYFFDFCDRGLFYHLYKYTLNDEKTSFSDINFHTIYYDALKLLKIYKTIIQNGSNDCVSFKKDIDKDFVESLGNELEKYIETKVYSAKFNSKSDVMTFNENYGASIEYSIISNEISFLKKYFGVLGKDFNKQPKDTPTFDIINKYLKYDLSLYLDELLNNYTYVGVDDNKSILVNNETQVLYKIDNNNGLRVLPVRGKLDNKQNIEYIALKGKDKKLVYFEFNDNYLLVSKIRYDNKFNIGGISTKFYDSSIIYYIMNKNNFDLYDSVIYFVENYEELEKRINLIPDEEIKVYRKDISDVRELNITNLFEYVYKENNRLVYISSIKLKDCTNIIDLYNTILDINGKKYIRVKKNIS